MPTQSLRELCSLLGYSRQAYYKSFRAEEKEALEHELILQQVGVLRKTQKRRKNLRTRKRRSNES